MTPLQLSITLPGWADELERVGEVHVDPTSRMALAVEASRRNVEMGTGGPFGAVLFGATTGRLLALGVNAVVRLRNPVLHAETMAVMRACARNETFTLAHGSGTDEPVDLYSSCEPCAMCLGALLWSGVRRVVFAARRDDAERLGFDEGPVFPETFAYLRRRGVFVEQGPLRSEARDVMARYHSAGGPIYNG